MVCWRLDRLDVISRAGRFPNNVLKAFRTVHDTRHRLSVFPKFRTLLLKVHIAPCERLRPY
jgi:hypothetical protein